MPSLGDSEWRKVLYLSQPYPDNYIDPAKFLDGLKKNVFTRTYTWTELVWASATVVQEFTCVCLFVCLYWSLQEEWLHPITLLAVSTSITLLLSLSLSSSLCLFVTDPVHLKLSEICDVLQPSLLFTLFLCGVSPILYTLTEAISTDTIWAMTVGMLAVHLLFHNYGSDGALVSSAISLNASVFASVCLASRLSSALDAFVMVALAVQMFALFPELRSSLRDRHPISSPLFTLLLVTCCTPLVAMVTYTGLTFYLLCVVCLCFLCPLWLCQLQHLKNNIYGPWDEAAIQH